MRPLAKKLALVCAAVLALACQKPDVGASCTLQWGNDPSAPPPTPQTASGDYFQTGNLACDDLVCIVSPASASQPKYTNRCTATNGQNCGYCSKPCVSDQDCYTSDTGLVCAQIVLDPLFMAELQKTDPAVLQRYLSDIKYSSYCVVPR